MSDDKNLSTFIYQYQKTLGELERKAQMSAWKWMDNDLSVTLSNATIQNGGETVLRCDNAELCLPQADAIRLCDYLINSYPLSEVTK